VIVDVVKYLVVGTSDEIGHFFEKAQEAGFLEFASISGKKSTDLPVTVQSLLTALKILRRYPAREPHFHGGDLAFAMQLSERIVEIRDDLEKLYEEKRLLTSEIARVAPFGDFSREDLEGIEREGKRRVQFFCMKTAKSHKTNFTDEIVYIGTEYDLDYFIAISKEGIVCPGMIEMRIDSPVGELELRLDIVEETAHRLEGELKEQTGYLDFLHETLVEEMNRNALTAAKREVVFPLKNTLFTTEVWVPKNKTDALFGLLDGMKVRAEEIAVEGTEKAPTHLENQGFGLLGEDLVKIYDTPAISDHDPSHWVLWFFVLFFSMIVADGGYGLVFLALALYLKSKFPKMKGEGRRFIKLSILLSTGCIVWGVLTSSYFGLKIGPDSLLSRISPLHMLVKEKAAYHLAERDEVYATWVAKYPAIAEARSGEECIELATVETHGSTLHPMLEEFSSNIILEFTLLLGVIHLTIAFLRTLRHNIAGLGWIVFMIGGFLYCPLVLRATSALQFMGWVGKGQAAAIGFQCLCGGLGFALLAAIVQRGIKKGISEIANLIQIFADVLSYLRLYALSLAGTILASTFNLEGQALGLVLGLVVILAGHAINISLAVMGGVIHGLRLNFLEWYRYCFEGGGRPFRPLRKLKRG
jgi:V/A-type H+-transporting ATPase subunit I